MTMLLQTDVCYEKTLRSLCTRYNRVDDFMLGSLDVGMLSINSQRVCEFRLKCS